MAAAPIVINVPIPPSTNNLFFNTGRKRARTKRYLSWLLAAGHELRAQRPGSINGPVAVSLTVERRSMLRDLDNTQKAPIDLLVTHKVIEDDRYIERITAQWGDVKGCRIEVRPVVRAPLLAEQEEHA